MNYTQRTMEDIYSTYMCIHVLVLHTASTLAKHCFDVTQRTNHVVMVKQEQEQEDEVAAKPPTGDQDQANSFPKETNV